MESDGKLTSTRSIYFDFSYTEKVFLSFILYALFMVVRKRRTEHHRFSKKHDRRSIIATELLVVVNRWSLTFVITFDFLQNPSLSSHYQHRGNLLHEFGFVQKRLQKAQLWYVKSQEILCGARIVRFKTIIESVVDKKITSVTLICLWMIAVLILPFTKALFFWKITNSKYHGHKIFSLL